LFDKLQALFAMDEQDCGKRYLCELAASPVDTLSKEERRTIDMIQVKCKGLIYDKLYGLHCLLPVQAGCESSEHTKQQQKKNNRHAAGKV
jgi:hypothetical protein